MTISFDKSEPASGDTKKVLRLYYDADAVDGIEFSQDPTTGAITIAPLGAGDDLDIVFGGKGTGAPKVGAEIVENQGNKGQADGYASLDSGGLVPSAELGSGTPDGTTFLRGDQTWATPAGGSLSDGDKGDITVSASGATWTIDSAAVTLAKMADLAQDQFIGRVTASTGVPETATITAAARTVLDDTTVAAMVDTLGGASSTGSGGLVRATSPTLVTPALGTPASGTLTNCTGLPIAGGGTGQSTQTAAMDALSPTTTKGDLLIDDGTNVVRMAVGTNGKVPVADSSATPGVAWGYRPMCIAFWARGDSTLTLSNCPAGDTLVPSSGVARMVVKSDLSTFRQARLVGERDGGTVATGMTMHLRYHTAFSSTVGDYVAIGTSAVSVACDPASPPKYMDSGWVDLAVGARADDVFIALVTNGGDGASDPTFGNIYAYFR